MRICKYCGKSFETRKLLDEHIRGNCSNHKFYPRNRTGICPRCHEHYDGWLDDHFKICPAVQHDHKHTEESRRKISEARSKWLREHPDKYPWRRKDKFKSIPCEHLKEILKKDGYVFQEEFTDSRWSHHYSLDIAFLDKKLAVEVNGTQHYNKEGKLAPYYQKRHDYLESQGWIILEIFYTSVFKSEEIEKIKKAIDKKQQIPDDEQQTLIRILVERREKEKENRKLKNKSHKKSRAKTPKPKLKLNSKISNGQLNRIFKIVITNIKNFKREEKLQEKLNLFKKWEERKEKILSSNIDLTKYGWIGKIIKETGMTKRIIYGTINHFPNEFSHCYFENKR